METIIFEKHDGVASIILNRPEVKNAISPQMHKDLRQTIEICSNDTDIRVVIITGAGNAFCAGGDVSAMAERVGKKITQIEQLERYRKDSANTVLAISRFSKPIIAKINGAAVGAGCNMTLACDFRIASEDAIFGEVFVKRGLIPDWGGMFFLPRVVGLPNALELCLTGKIIKAQEAKRIGLVNYVVKREELNDYVQEFAKNLAEAPPIAVKFIKEALKRSFNHTLEETLDYESFAQSLCQTTDDHVEGIKSFLEKRNAKFVGK